MAKKSKKDDITNDEMADNFADDVVADADLNAEDDFQDASADEEFDNFDQDDFVDLDNFNEEENQDDEFNDSFDDDLSTEFHGADPDLPPEMEEPQTKKSLVEFLKENWLYASIGIVVVLVALYLIMSLFSPDTPQQPQQPKNSTAFTSLPAKKAEQVGTTQKNTTTPIAKPKAQINLPNPATVKTATVTVPKNVTLSDKQVNELIAGMTKVIEKNNAKIGNEISQATMATSNTKLKTLENNVAALSKNVTTLNKNLSAVQIELARTQKQLGTILATETANHEELTLRAVVPGRAWLVNKKGHTLSVTEGTKLGSFGTVTDIDTDNNSVTTSSGYVFK